MFSIEQIDNAIDKFSYVLATEDPKEYDFSSTVKALTELIHARAEIVNDFRAKND